MATVEDEEVDEGLLSPAEQIARRFYTWELRGRGWQVESEPVWPEPPFEPFARRSPYAGEVTDDGRKHTLVSGVFEWLHRKLRGMGREDVATELAQGDEEQEPERREWRDPDGITELQVVIPSTFAVSPAAAEQFLLSLCACRFPPAFELIGLSDSIFVQLACADEDADHVRAQLHAYFPEVSVRSRPAFLEGCWQRAGNTEAVVADFGLAREFMLPLSTSRSFDIDPLLNLITALSEMRDGEVGLFQVLFTPVRNRWAESALRSVIHSDGTPLFTGIRDFVKQAKAKVASPLYAVVLRIGVISDCEERACSVGQRLSRALMVWNDLDGNELVPLDNEGYSPGEHESDLLGRRSRRSGMLLSSKELISLVHLPSASVRIAKLRGDARATKAAPPILMGHRLILGDNAHAGDVRAVTLSPEQRSRHMHVIGASGTGKSTFLLNLIVQDIEAGDGVAVLDPHGDLVDAVIDRIPPQRIPDVVLFDPADEDFPVGFNILTAHSALEQNLLSSDLVAIFRRLSTSWGDQMNSVLGNAILAFLESSRGGTLLDLRRFLVEPAFRKEFLPTVRDREIAYYWEKEFPLLTGKPQGPVLTRLDTFLRPKPVRYMVAQKECRLDFADMMDSGKIFLARLSHGAIGEENAHLLGSLIVSKFHQMVLGRQRVKERDRRYFWLYVDEFQNFATPSMASILSGARKYRLGLILAHQEMHRVERAAPDVASAVIANAYTRVCFRLGDDDARKLASGFAAFSAEDLQNLSIGEAICRAERAEMDFNLYTPEAEEVEEEVAAQIRNQVIELSRTKYAVPRRIVEEQLNRGREVAETKEEVSADTPVQQPPAPPPIAEKTAAVQVAGAPEPPPPAAVSPTTVAPRSSAKKVKPAAAEPAMMGRGGPEHKYLQNLIKQYAEGMGYRASIEEKILDGQGVDVALWKGNVSVACEICITTDDLHEVGNVQKCIAAGYKHVAVISPDGHRLNRLRRVVEEKLSEVELKRIGFFDPQALFSFIQELEIQQLNQERTVKGYKLNTKYTALDEDELAQRRESVSRIVAGAARRTITKKRKT